MHTKLGSLRLCGLIYNPLLRLASPISKQGPDRPELSLNCASLWDGGGMEGGIWEVYEPRFLSVGRGGVTVSDVCCLLGGSWDFGTACRWADDPTCTPSSWPCTSSARNK